MPLVQKIDSNIIRLAYAEETSPNVLPNDPLWKVLEPNALSNFGSTLTTISRNPLNPSRQRKKGVISDRDATGSFPIDMTQTNLQDILQGFLFADVRSKHRTISTAVAQSSKTYTVAASGRLPAGSFIFASGFSNPENNGRKTVVNSPDATHIEVKENLADEPAAPENAQISFVGLQSSADDMSIDATGSLPALVSKTVDFTQTELIPGEWIWIGGKNDDPASRFASEENNGFKRIKTILQQRLIFDKSEKPMVADTGSGKSLQVFFGRVFKNELGTLVKRRSYQFELTLGSPDTEHPDQLQSQYLTGAVANELTINIAQADKITAELAFVASKTEQRTAAQGLKPGKREEPTEQPGFNTSKDFQRIKLSEYIPGNASPNPLFTFLSDITLTLNNNVTPLKAVGVLGAFDTSAGTLEIGGNLTAYFATVEALNAVDNNIDTTFDIFVLQENAGFVIDLPLVTLGDANLTPEENEAIKLPLTMTAATGSKLDRNLDYTIMFVFFDYLPFDSI